MKKKLPFILGIIIIALIIVLGYVIAYNNRFFNIQNVKIDNEEARKTEVYDDLESKIFIDKDGKVNYQKNGDSKAIKDTTLKDKALYLSTIKNCNDTYVIGVITNKGKLYISHYDNEDFNFAFKLVKLKMKVYGIAQETVKSPNMCNKSEFYVYNSNSQDKRVIFDMDDTATLGKSYKQTYSYEKSLISNSINYLDIYIYKNGKISFKNNSTDFIKYSNKETAYISYIITKNIDANTVLILTINSNNEIYSMKVNPLNPKGVLEKYNDKKVNNVVPEWDEYFAKSVTINYDDGTNEIITSTYENADEEINPYVAFTDTSGIYK